MAEPSTTNETATGDIMAKPSINGHGRPETRSPTKSLISPPPDPDDPQRLVIASLRSQISDLFSQVSQLNNKLVQSYDRVSDLEDDLHIANANLRGSSVQISQLELERTQHLAALNTGLLVEKDQVTAELTRVMEKATEEAARRGQAESARADIEKDLDDLSASLFAQANTMVAEARFQKSVSDRKVVDAELALRGAEEAVSGMQVQMQQLREDKEKSDRELIRLTELMGKGKWVERPPSTTPAIPMRLLSSHAPFQEFLLFLAHLRTTKSSLQQQPAISALLSLPFLARLHSEDIDPTLRLEMAPSLNWLSRRSIISAIHTGQFTIEPVSSHSSLLDQLSPSPILSSAQATIACALCGMPIFPISSTSTAPPPLHPLSRANLTQQLSWSSSLFKLPLTSSAAPSPPLTPPPYQQHHIVNGNGTEDQMQHIHVFRFPSTSSNPLPQNTQQKLTTYPLCPSGWCLSRLRTTCSLLAFVRSGLIDRVWEDTSNVHAPQPSQRRVEGKEKEVAPPLPPRRRSKMGGMSMGSLWGMASGALATSRTPSQNDSAIAAEEKDISMSTPTLPPPPPPRRHSQLPSAALVAKEGSPPTKSLVPPPLPRRNLERARKDDVLADTGNGHHDTTEDLTPTAPVFAASTAGLQGRITPPHGLTPATSSSSGGDFTQDGFITPAEELSEMPQLAMLSESPVSPTSIPLPESTPATPTTKTFPTDGLENNSHVRTNSVRSIAADRQIGPLSQPESPIPIRSISPMPKPTSHPASPATDAKRTGSPVPPPLPRRAARRPLPHPGPGTDTVTHENLTPSQAESSLPVEPTIMTPSFDDTAVPLPSAQASSTAVHLTEDVQADSRIASASAPDAEDVQLQENDYGVSSEPTTRPLTPPEIVMTADAILESEQARGESETQQKSDQADMSGIGISPLGPFMGKETWEERSWREIVRLREEMFWARVGALRS